MRRDPTCTTCRQPLAAGVPAWRGEGSDRLCLPCAMGLALPDRAGRGAGGELPRFRLPAVVSAAVSVEIDLGTGRSWAAGITDFSADGLRLLAPVHFAPGTPAVLTLRDLEGRLPPAVFAVEVRWARPAPRGRFALGARVIAAVDGHHAAFLGRVLERVAAVAR